MIPVLADKQRAVRIFLKRTNNQRVIVEILNLLFSQWSIRVSRVSGLEMHVRDKLPELHRVGIVLLPVRIALLGKALLDDSARLKQTVRDYARVTLGTVLVLHGERHERAVGYKAIHAGVSSSVRCIRRVDRTDRQGTDTAACGSGDYTGQHACSSKSTS